MIIWHLHLRAPGGLFTDKVRCLLPSPGLRHSLVSSQHQPGEATFAGVPLPAARRG